MDNRQENVYALNMRGYFHTSRPSNHPSIILANQRNVHLSYVTCNQIFRGQSTFRNPQAEDFYRESRSLPSKSQMYKSEITDATTNAHDDHIKNSHDLKINIKPHRRETRLISTSFHSGNTKTRIDNPHGVYTSRIEIERPVYQYEQTNKLQIPKTLEQLKNFKSETLMREVNRNQGSYTSRNDLKLIKTLQEGAKLESSYHLSDLSKSNAAATNNEGLKNTLAINKNLENDLKKEAEQKLKQQKEKQAIELQEKIQKQRQKNLIIKSPEMSQIQVQTPQKIIFSKPQPYDKNLTPQHPTVYTSAQPIYTPSKPPIVYRSVYKQISSSPQVDKNMTPSTEGSYFVRQSNPDWSNSPNRQQYVAESPRTPQHINPELEQLARLRLELAKRDQQLAQCKKSLEASQQKNKFLDLQVKKLQTANTKTIPTTSKSVIISSPVQSSYNHSHQLANQLGGPMNALLYFTLFIVLLSKEMSGK